MITIIFWLTLAIFLILAWRRLDLSLQVLIFLLPSYLWRTHIFGLPTSFLEMMIVSVTLVWLIKNKNNLIDKVKKHRRYPFDWEMISLAVLAFAASGMAGFSTNSLGIFKAYFLEPIFLFIVIFNIFGPKGELKKIIWPLMLSALGVSIIAWLQHFVDLNWLNFSGTWGGGGRAVSIFNFPNALGLYLGPILALSLAYGFKRVKELGFKAGEVLVLFGIIILQIGALIFSQSEGALAGVLAVGILYFLLAKTSRIYWWTILATLIILLVLPFSRNIILEKVTLSDVSGEIRQELWRETGQMMSLGSNWLWGVGLDNFQANWLPFRHMGIFYNFDHDPKFQRNLVFGPPAYKATHWVPTDVYHYPHNLILNFWTELGLLGVLLFAWIIIKYLTIAIKLAKVSKDKWLLYGLIGMMLAQLVHGSVDIMYFKNDLSVLFWLEIAMVSILLVNNKRELK